MKIAHFTESYIPVVNGAAVAVELLREELSIRNDVGVFAPHHPGAGAPAAGIHRFPSYTLPAHRDYPLAIPWSRSLWRSFQAGEYCVVHTHSPFSLGQVGRLWARRTGLPLVTTYHTLYLQYAHYARPLPHSLVGHTLRQLSRSYCEQADAVIVPTAPIAEELRAYGVTRPIHVIPTGLRLCPPGRHDRAATRARWNIAPGAPLVLYAGRIAAEKNLPLLLEAFDMVRSRLPQARLLLCGAGPALKSVTASVAALRMEDAVIFAGLVAPEEMPAVYASSDLFAFSSLFDTQGLVLNEAKAAGLPAVAVDSYGPGEIITDGVDGFLVPPDARAMADRMLQLLTDPALARRMSEAALREADRFSICETARRYEEVYREVLEGRGRSRRVLPARSSV